MRFCSIFTIILGFYTTLFDRGRTDECYSELMPSTLSQFEVPRLRRLSATEFYRTWDGVWPVVVTDVVEAWPASRWTTNNLCRRYADSNVLVSSSRTGSLADQEGSEMRLSDLCSLVVKQRQNDSAGWVYLSDEIFLTQHDTLFQDIGHNPYSEEDYFQLFPESIKPMNAMLLWGTRGSRSKLHVDPYNWTGSLALISGVKHWKLYPPHLTSQLSFIRQRLGFPLDCHHLISSLDLFSDLSKGTLLPCPALEYMQSSGELLIIPSGWAHQVYNAEESLAISSQFMNRNSYQAVLSEISLCTGWDGYASSPNPETEVLRLLDWLTLQDEDKRVKSEL